MSDAAAWLATARRYVGVREIPGPKSDPTILGWARRMGGWVASWFRDDAEPWCALFANAVLQECGFPLSGPIGSAALVRAKSFLAYGTPLAEPALGCLVVLDRPGGGGHVCFYTGETITAVRGIGGNQDDQVKESFFKKTRVRAYRWPPGAPAPVIGRKYLLSSGAVSRDER